jgi:hypothetical protein
MVWIYDRVSVRKMENQVLAGLPNVNPKSKIVNPGWQFLPLLLEIHVVAKFLWQTGMSWHTK